MKHSLATRLLGLSLLALGSASAQDDLAPVRYRLSFAPGDTTWKVEVRLPEVPAGPAEFWFPRWTPGAYHLADYGRFVDDDLHATAGEERLAVAREHDSLFRFSPPVAGEVTVRYEAASLSDAIFTDNVIDVEANRIRPDYAYVNPVSLFGLLWEQVERPVELELDLPAGWRVGTALERVGDNVYRAPSYRRFEDSPLLLSPTLRTAEFTVAGKRHRVSSQGLGEEAHARLADGCRRIVEVTAELLQGLPYTHYDFLLGFVPEGQGSGLEHSFSTLILSSPAPSLEDDNHGLWGIIAHEFFHTWCAERIHVEGLHAPDQTQPFQTGTLWVNEGITEYFTQHILVQAGFLSEEQFLADLGGKLPAFGTGSASWTEVSRAARDWGSMNDLMAFATRMYFLGPRTIFALDLEMRRVSKGERGVLDLLRFLRHAYIDRDRGFEEGEMIDLASGIAQGDLRPFYRRFIAGAEVIDVGPWLEVLGFERQGGAVVRMAAPSPAQDAALEDFFSIDG